MLTRIWNIVKFLLQFVSFQGNIKFQGTPLYFYSLEINSFYIFFCRLQQFIVNQEWNDPKSKLQQCCLTLRTMDGGEPDIPVYKVKIRNSLLTLCIVLIIYIGRCFCRIGKVGFHHV